MTISSFHVLSNLGVNLFTYSYGLLTDNFGDLGEMEKVRLSNKSERR